MRAHRLEYSLFWGARRFIGSLSHERALAFGRMLGSIGYRLSGSRRRLTHDNLARVFPDLTAAERAAIARKSFRHFSSYFVDLVFFSTLDARDVPRHFAPTDFGPLEGAGERGLLLAGGHYGSWELGLFPLGERLGSIHAVFRPPSNPLIARDVISIRDRNGVVPIGKRGATRACLKVVLGGGHIALAADQYFGGNSAVEVDFLGVPSMTSPLLAMLSDRTGAPVVPSRCLRRADGKYQLSFEEPIFPEGRSRSELTELYQHHIEDDIRKQPELWLWAHRRWRDGSTGSAA